MNNTLKIVIETLINYIVIMGPVALFLYLINRATNQPNLRRISFFITLTGFFILSFLGVVIGSYKTLLINSEIIKPLTNFFVFSPYLINKSYLIGIAILFPSVLAILFLLPFNQKYLHTIFPSMNPKNPVHTISLSLSMVILITFLTNIIIGIDHLTYVRDQWEIIASVWIQNLFLAFISLIGVGFLSRRSFKESLSRLEITNVTIKEFLRGIGIGVILSSSVLLIEIVLVHYGILNPNISKSTDELIAPLFHSITGILTLGFAAAIGEETIFRGALLPRFGIIFSAFLFSLLHVHYGISIHLFIIFLLGIILGFLRRKYNTTVTLTIHATYNIMLGLIVYSKLF